MGYIDPYHKPSCVVIQFFTLGGMYSRPCIQGEFRCSSNSDAADSVLGKIMNIVSNKPYVPDYPHQAHALKATDPITTRTLFKE